MVAAQPRSTPTAIDNLGGWLTTVVARLCLNVLRSRRAHPEEPLDVHVPDPVVSRDDSADPEHEALLADSVGLALLVVLETLTPAERLAFVLHDMFAVPFEEVAEIAGRTPDAVRQLASRARRRVQGAPTRARQRPRTPARGGRRLLRRGARGGDFDALVAVLDPDVVLRSDGGAARPAMTRTVRGAVEVAGGALTFAGRRRRCTRYSSTAPPASSSVLPSRPFSVMAFTVVDGKIVAIDAVADPDRLARLDLSAIWGVSRPGEPAG